MGARFASASLLFLLGMGVFAAEMTLQQTAIFGQVAILTEGPVRLEVALTEGCRLIGWQLDGQELLYARRSWGGDGYDRFSVAGQAGDTRHMPPSAVDALRQGDLAALRARFRLPGGAELQRIIALSPDGVFLESRINPAVDAWYEFALHLSHGKSLPLSVVSAANDGGTLSSRLLQAKEDYSDLPPSLALAGWHDDWTLLWHCGDELRVHPRVWGDNLSFGLAAKFKGAPLRASCQWRKGEELSRGLPPPAIFPSWTGQWSPLSFAVDETPRAEPCAIAREFGPFGVCASDPKYLAPLAAAGIRWLRLGGFSWASCEANAGQRDFSAVANVLAAAQKEGLALIGLMNGCPGWASRDGSRAAPPKDWSQWREHVAQVVAAFRDQVQVWEIWNEPDIKQFWRGSNEDYVQLLRIAYQAAKEADPNCLVMSAGLDGVGEGFFDRILTLGAGDAFDIVGVHPYANSIAAAEYRLRIMRRIMNYHAINKPLWITELGWQSGGWRGGPGVVASEEIKAARLREAYERIPEQVDVICWYTGVEAGAMYGLMQPMGTQGFILNPAWFALRELALASPEGLSIEAVSDASLQVGEEQLLSATIRSQDPSLPLQSLRARWLGAEPEWLLGSREARYSDTHIEHQLRLRLPSYLRPSQRHLLLTLQDQQGRHVASHAIAITIENPGRYCELKLSGDWIQRLDREGKSVGSWTPARNLSIPAGEGFIQPLRPTNQGNAEERLLLTLSGTAAAWLEPYAENFNLAAGERGWVGLRVRVPEDAPTGSYSLDALLQAESFPGLRTEWHGSYSIINPKDTAEEEKLRGAE
jgi:hypothetical protein